MPSRRYPPAVLPAVQARGLVLIVCLLSSGAASAQTHDASSAPGRNAPAGTATNVDVDALPISLERIGEQLEKPSVLDLSATRPTFRVQIYGKRPRWTSGIDWLGTAEGGKPPVGTPWHDQFLNMVTPPEARSFGAFTGTDLLQVMATSLAQGLAAGVVVGKIKSSLRERREREAREEVDAAIAEWKKERDAAAAMAAQPPP